MPRPAESPAGPASPRKAGGSRPDRGGASNSARRLESGRQESPASPVSPRDDGGPSPRHGDDDEPLGYVPVLDRAMPQGFFGLMVVVNGMFIGLEVHFRAVNGEESMAAITMLAEIVFFGVFLVELILRIATDRCPAFMYKAWNVIDLVLVVGSGVDLLMQFALSSSAGAAQDLGKLRAVRLLRVTRLVRLLRIFRVFRFRIVLRAVRGLLVLVVAIARAMGALGWVCFLMAGTTYLCAIVTTEFVGLANDDGDPEIQEWFGDLLRSMFTLMQLSTLDSWGYISRYVGRSHGAHWQLFLLAYVIFTNLIVLNVVLATLIDNVILLNTEVKEARIEGNEDAPSWMKTPSSLGSKDDEEGDDGKQAAATAAGALPGQLPGMAAGAGALQQSVADRLATQTLSEFFDIAAVQVGIEGVNQRKLITEKSLGDALLRLDVQTKLVQTCPPLAGREPSDMCASIWNACPKRFDKSGLSRQEIAEAVLALRGEMSMNHFVSIAQSLEKLERHVEHELMHLNKHQRKMNRRFLKLRHRLRKVYHFDGAPRKMVEMVQEMKRRTLAQAAEAALRGDPSPLEVLERRKQETGDAGSSDVDLSDASSKSSKSNEDDLKW